jgi:hypothetical protein
MKSGLKEKGEISSGDWISFNNGRIKKRGTKIQDIDPHTAPMFYFLVQVDNENYFPDLRSKRKYGGHRVKSKDWKNNLSQ